MKMNEFKETYLKNYGKKEKLSKEKLEEQDERKLNERYEILEINIWIDRKRDMNKIVIFGGLTFWKSCSRGLN